MPYPGVQKFIMHMQDGLGVDLMWNFYMLGWESRGNDQEQ